MWIAMGSFLAMASIVFVLGLLSAQKEAKIAKLHKAHRSMRNSAHESVTNSTFADAKREIDAARTGAGNQHVSQYDTAFVGSGQGSAH